MTAYSFRPGSGFLGYSRLVPPSSGAELLDVSLGCGSTAVCTWRLDELVDPRSNARGHHIEGDANKAAEVVTHHNADGEVLHRWDLTDPLLNAAYQALPGNRLLAYSRYLSMSDNARRSVLVYDSSGKVISTGSFDFEVTDVRVTESGKTWVAHDGVVDGDHSREDYGLELYSSDFNRLWMATEDSPFWSDPMSVLGADVLFTDVVRPGIFCTQQNVRLENAPEAGDWVLHEPELRRWAFINDSQPDRLEATLGWADYRDQWKPHLKGPLVLPFASPMERTKVECDATSIHVWVGQRWYKLELKQLFDDSIRTTPPRLPDVNDEPGDGT